MNNLYQVDKELSTSIKQRFSFFKNKIFVIFMVSYLAIFAGLMFETQHFSKQEVYTARKGAAKSLVLCLKEHLHIFRGKSIAEADRKLVSDFRGIVKEKVKVPATTSLFFSFLIAFLYFKFISRKGKNETDSEEVQEDEAFERYKKLVSQDENGIKIGGYDKKQNILIEKDTKQRDMQREKSLRKNSIAIEKEDETSHFFVLGQSGTGKTVLLSQIVEQLKNRKQKMVVHDNKMDFVTKFYDPTKDLIFNPMDERAIGWSILNEINSIIDIESIAYSLVPAPNFGEPFWNNNARDILIETLKYAKANSISSNKDLFALLNLSRVEMIKKLNSKVVNKLLENEKSAADILSTLHQFIRGLEYLKDGDFNVKKWIESEENNTIFLTNRKDISDMIAPLLSLFVDLVSKKLLSENEDLDRRVYFILDELTMLNKLSSVVDLITNGRSKGASVLIAVQDLARLKKIYDEEFNTIFGNCSTKIFFRIGDNFTVQHLNKYAGTEEIERTDQSLSFQENSENGNLHIRKHVVLDDKLKVSKLTNLQDRMFLIKVRNFEDFMLLKTYVREYKKYNTPFKIREDIQIWKMHTETTI